MLLQHDMLTDTSLPFVAPGLQHGGIWMYLIQRKHWSYDRLVMWNEQKAGSTDPVLTTSLSLKTLSSYWWLFFSYLVNLPLLLHGLKKERDIFDQVWGLLSQVFYLFNFLLSWAIKLRRVDYRGHIYDHWLSIVPANVVDGTATVALPKFVFWRGL